MVGPSEEKGVTTFVSVSALYWPAGYGYGWGQFEQ